MQIEEFFNQLNSEVISRQKELENSDDVSHIFSENVFTSVFLQHMEEAHIISNPQICYFDKEVKNKKVKINGYSLELNQLSEDETYANLDLFVCCYNSSENLEEVSLKELEKYIYRAWDFFKFSLEGTLKKKLEQSSEEYVLAELIQQENSNIDRVTIYVISNFLLNENSNRSLQIKVKEIQGKSVKFELYDLNRLFKNFMSGSPRDEVVVDFPLPLPCVYVPSQDETYAYDYALTAVPGTVLYSLYERYTQTLLEANVRSFLMPKGKVNSGIKQTLIKEPERFMAYNNGLVIVTKDMEIVKSETGLSISKMKGFQIVNGGQTTASIYFDKKKNKEINLDLVSVPAKIIKIRNDVSYQDEEDLLSLIAKYANSQNIVKTTDLSSNKRFHVVIEEIMSNLWCGEGDQYQWFYERTTGSYNVKLAIEGTTPLKQRAIKKRIPSGNKITKTDLGMYWMAWERKPYNNALGPEKNFAKFMELMEEQDSEQGPFTPDLQWVKDSIVKAIIYKTIHKLVLKKSLRCPAVVTNYTVSYFSEKYGDKLDFKYIWDTQSLSSECKEMLSILAINISNAINQSSSSVETREWAKKIANWELIKTQSFDDDCNEKIPEIVD